LAEPEKPNVVTATLSGTITAPSVELVKEAIDLATATNSTALVLSIDTPGGDMDATLSIMELIERSPTPVVTWVSPIGAKAWSAGTYILMSSHVAAMAPNTIIGSCQPVTYSPTEGAKPVEDPKIINALTALLVEKAKMRGRNEDVAVRFITENLNLNADQAKSLGVVEVVASTTEDLLAAVDGLAVETISGWRTLSTQSAPILRASPSLRVSILTTLSDPTLASALFLIGIFGLIYGLTTPGYAAEVIGGIAMFLGLIGLGFSVNTGALLILGLGAILLFAESRVPGFGILGIAGIFCIIIGGLLLAPSYVTISREWYTLFTATTSAVSLILGGFTFVIIYKVAKARRLKPVLGKLVGETAEALDEITPSSPGYVMFRGEYWKARSTSTIARGQKVLIKSKEGPVLLVEPAENKL
jgi:membrane-bound serine protease (ClpP class)